MAWHATGWVRVRGARRCYSRLTPIKKREIFVFSRPVKGSYSVFGAAVFRVKDNSLKCMVHQDIPRETWIRCTRWVLEQEQVDGVIKV